MSEHGTNNGYTNRKCRCEPCATAHTDYQAAWRAEQRRLAALGKAVERAVRGSK